MKLIADSARMHDVFMDCLPTCFFLQTEHATEMPIIFTCHLRKRHHYHERANMHTYNLHFKLCFSQILLFTGTLHHGNDMATCSVQYTVWSAQSL